MSSKVAKGHREEGGSIAPGHMWQDALVVGSEILDKKAFEQLLSQDKCFS